jgi:PAS domain S-box-containing protein
MTLFFAPGSLASRMRMALVLTAGLLSLGALGMLLLTRKASQEAGRLYDVRVLPLLDLDTIAEAYAIQMTGALRQVRSGDMPPAEGLKRVREARARADQAWKRFRSEASKGSQPLPVEILEARRSAVNYLQGHLETRLALGMSPELGAFGDHQWIPTVNAMMESLQDLREDHLREAQQLSQTLTLAGQRATQSGLILILSAGLLSLGFSHVFARRISRGATDLVERLRRVADGDLSPAPPSTGRDELAQAQRELDRTVARLNQLVGDLRDQRALEQSLLDSAEMAVIGLDLEGRVSRWSRGAEELLGYTSDEVIGKATPDLWRVPEELEDLRNQLQQRLGHTIPPGVGVFHAAASLPGFLVECHYRPRQGALIPVVLSISMIKAQDGQVLGTMGVALDMRRVRQLEARLRESERQYRGLVERLPGVVLQWRISPAGQRSIPFVSPQIEAMFGVSPEAFQASPNFLLDHFYEEDRAFFLHLFHQATELQSPLEWEGRTFTDRPGETRWLRFRAKPTLQPDGDTLWDALLEDLSSLKETETALADAEERWKLALDANRDGIWDFDVAKRTFWVSPRYKTMLGYTDQNWTIDGESFRQLLHPEDESKARRNLEAFLQGKEDRYQDEFRMRHQDGSWRWILSRGSATRNAQGAIVRVVGSHADITEQRQQEQSLRESEARAQSASRAKSAFLANMSHELRTPLSAILGYARLLDREEWRTEEERLQLQHILRAGEHLLSLINDVLSLSKIEAGRVEFRPASFRPEELFIGIEGLFRLSATGKGLQFHVERSHFPPVLEGDISKLRQVLVNLLGNALKFTEEGHVSLTAQWVNGKAWFTVEDSGSGISPEDQSRIFQAFSQTEHGAAAGGTGLGLHISQALVRLMGGEIVLMSQIGRGSRFNFEIPLPEPELSPSLSTPREVGRLLVEGDPPLLLVVDDRPENRDVLGRLLQKVGFRVEFAEDGSRALARWAIHHPRLILMDLRMPIMDGFQATAAIRTQEAAEKLARTPIVAISASVYDTTAEELRQVGFDDFLTKPIEEAALFSSLESHLGVHFEARAPESISAVATGIEALSQVSPEWRDRFKACVSIGDLDAAMGLLEELDHPALVQALATHLRAYHVQQLLDHLG